MLKFINADEINTTTELCNAVSDKDNIINAVAVTGTNALLESLWKTKSTDLIIYKVNYTDDNCISHGKNRHSAVWELFRRWDNAGLNIYHAKSPYACKNFTKFINIDRYTADTEYVIFLEKVK